jgi:hypothetical protein
MDCVKACPHDNIGLVARAMTHDVLSNEPTSSLGRLHRRVDVGAAALLLVGSAFVNAAVMVGPGSEFLGSMAARFPWLGTDVGSFAGVVIAALLFAGVVWLVAQAARGAWSRSEAFCRGALALLPLGVGMWAAHLVFHLASAIPALLPLAQQAGQDFGVRWMGAPHWTGRMGMLQGNGLLQIQLLLLDGGLLLSLYLLWRMARRVMAAIPMALLTLALYGFGFWLLLEPMQMRGMMMGGM